MGWLQHALYIMNKIGKAITPILIGYEINEVIDKKVQNEDIGACWRAEYSLRIGPAKFASIFSQIRKKNSQLTKL